MTRHRRITVDNFPCVLIIDDEGLSVITLETHYEPEFIFKMYAAKPVADRIFKAIPTQVKGEHLECVGFQSA